MFLHDIVVDCIKYQIPDELIIIIDQTPSRYVATDKVTMPEKELTINVKLLLSWPKCLQAISLPSS